MKPDPTWAAFKAKLIRQLGREGAAAWLRFAADTMEREARIAKPEVVPCNA